jgi:hypothetical protein
MRCYNPLVSSALVLSVVLFVSFMAAPVQAEATLVGYWDLDEASGTTAADSATPPSSDGTLAGGTSWTTGYLNGGLAFDGNGDLVDMGLGGSDELAITGDLTMDFWLNPTGVGDQKYGPLVGINMSGGSWNDAYFTDIIYTASVTGDTGIAAGTLEFGITEWDGVNKPVNVVLRSNTAMSVATDNETWYHVRVEYEAGERMAIYINDVLDAELTSGVPSEIAYANYSEKPTPRFALGNLGQGSSVTTYCYNGNLDEVRVYSGVVPEPTGLVLLGSALLGLVLRRRRNG